MSEHEHSDEQQEDPPSKGRVRRASDVPPDTLRERESFVRTFVRKGMQYTEELLRENDDLRSEISELREEVGQLRSQVASDDAIRDLLRTVERLETERRKLLERSRNLEASHREEEGRHQEIEREVSDLANLYVASHQLHTSLSVPRVVQHLHDMLGQLVGAASFMIYVLDEERLHAVPVASEAVPADYHCEVPLDGHRMGDVCLTGLPKVREPAGERPGSLDDPIAIIPFLADGRAVGVASVFRLLPQKIAWADVDLELFKLLGAQAGAALIAANLYRRVASPTEALRGIPRAVEAKLGSTPEGENG